MTNFYHAFLFHTTTDPVTTVRATLAPASSFSSTPIRTPKVPKSTFSKMRFSTTTIQTTREPTTTTTYPHFATHPSKNSSQTGVDIAHSKLEKGTYWFLAVLLYPKSKF